MTWNYDPAISGPVDQVRFLVGDTDTTDQLLQDEEILFLLSEEGSTYLAGASAADRIAAKFSRQVTSRVGQTMQAALSDRSKQYLSLAASLRRRAGAPPYGGGITTADVLLHQQDTSLVPPDFRQGQDEEPVWGHISVDPTVQNAEI